MMRSLASRKTFDSTGPMCFGRGEAGNPSVGGVRQEQVHALLAQVSEVAQVGDAAIQRQLIHLEVTGVRTFCLPWCGCVDSQRIRNRVVHSNEHTERTETLTWCPSPRGCRAFDAEPGELRLNQCQGPVRNRPGGCGAAAQQVGNAPMWPRGRQYHGKPRRPDGRQCSWKSGRIRSTPGWDSSGKSTPQSTISSLPLISYTVMLRPTSPRPPRGTTRRVTFFRRRGGKIRFKDAPRVSPFFLWFSCDVCDSERRFVPQAPAGSASCAEAEVPPASKSPKVFKVFGA